MSERLPVALGDVLVRSSEILGQADEPAILTCTEREGLVLQSDRFNHRVAAEDTSKYKVVRPLDIVYNPYLLWLGAIAQNDLDIVGITSPVYEVFRLAEGAAVDVRYLGLLLTSEHFRPTYDPISIGSIPRRRRAPADSFLALKVELPPLSQQRRAVDLVTSALEVAERSSAVASAAQGALQAYLSEVIADSTPEGTSVADLCTVNVGGVWGSDPGQDEVDVRVLRSTDYSNFGHLTDAEPAIRSITKKQHASRLLEQNDLLLEKSGGTPKRPVARVLHLTDAPENSVCGNFIQLLRPDPVRVIPRYLFWLLWSWHQRGLPFAFQQASTNIRNLRTKEYLAQRVVLPTPTEQESVAATADAMLAVMRRAQEQSVRTNVLAADLFRDAQAGHLVPNAYDEFLDSK